MAKLHIRLFGRFELSYGASPLHPGLSTKAQELCSYLVLNRTQPHSREKLATVLWPECYSAGNTKAYLRKTLWQLQHGLESGNGVAPDSFLQVTSQWIQFSEDTDAEVDVSAFEDAYHRTKGQSGSALTSNQVDDLDRAVSLYRGALLENWYPDWCEFERDRLQNLYLTMLDKLLDYCAATNNIEAGLEYGDRSLKIDRARESTYRRLMELYSQAGDRTRGLRLFDQCVTALREELDIEPGLAIRNLYNQMRLGTMIKPVQSTPISSFGENLTVKERLERIKLLQKMHTKIQAAIQHNITAVEESLNKTED